MVATYDDFTKLEIRTVRITSVEAIEGKTRIALGVIDTGERTMISSFVKSSYVATTWRIILHHAINYVLFLDFLANIRSLYLIAKLS